MTNEHYLIVSYFLCAGVSLALGALVYLMLRRPFNMVADQASRQRLGSVLKKLFPCGLIFPALLGFVSVSYWSCNRTSYQKIIQSRIYLVERNQRQVSMTLFAIIVAVLFWEAIVLALLRYAKTGGDEPQTHDGST